MSECTKGKLELSSHCPGLAQIGGITRFAVFPKICNTPMQLARREANAEELVRRWNGYEEGGLVEELRTACSCLLRVIMRDEPKGGSISNEGVELANAALAKS